MIAKGEIKGGNLRLGDSTAICRRAGPFLFFGSQTPMDLETGTIVKRFRDVPDEVRHRFASGMPIIDTVEERILVQAWRIYQNVEEILAQQGTSLDKVVHQRIFLKDMRDMASLEKVILSFMSSERPATTIVEATNVGVNENIVVQADLVAIAGQEAFERENISVPGLDSLTAPYPLATKAGQYIFTTPIPGVDPETGRMVNCLEDLCQEDKELAEPPYFGRGEAAVTQHLTIFRHFRRILDSQGISLGSQIHQNGWLRIPTQEFGPLAKVRQNLFGGVENMGTCTSVTLSGIRREDALFEYSLIALIPPKNDNEYRKETPKAGHPFAGYYLPALKAGPLLFTSGEGAIETETGCVVNSFSVVRDEGRFVLYGRVHEEKPIMAEAWYVYQRLKSDLEENGSSMENVVHQSVYMVNPADYPVLESVATLFYGSRLPPTSLIPICGTSPIREVKLEIEVIAAASNG